MEYKVGDMVQVREDLVTNRHYGERVNFHREMAKFSGQTFTVIAKVRTVTGKPGYHLDVPTTFGGTPWVWIDEMLELNIPSQENFQDDLLELVAQLKEG